MQYRPDSYLRAIRRVMPSRAVTEFLEDAQMCANNVFGYQTARLVKRPALIDEQLQADYEPMYDGISRSAAQVFAVRSLRATLFERRAGASENINASLFRASERLTARRIRRNVQRSANTPSRSTYRPNTLNDTLRQYVPEHMTAPLKGIARAIVLQREADGTRHFALQLEKDSSLDQIFSQQVAAIEAYARRAVSCRPLFRDYDFLQLQPVASEIPFMAVPQATEAQHGHFVEVLSDNLQVPLQFSEIEWDVKLR